MLSYLDSLCSALIGRDRVALRHLLADPLAAELPDGVHKEIEACLSYAVRTAPLQTLHFYYQVVQRDRMFTVRTAASRPSDRDSVRALQFELPLTAA